MSSNVHSAMTAIRHARTRLRVRFDDLLDLLGGLGRDGDVTVAADATDNLAEEFEKDAATLRSLANELRADANK